MRCPRCQRPMLLLFYSAVCDACESPPRGTYYRAYVVWRETRGLEAPLDYVWRTPHDAVMWRSLQNLEDEAEVRCVLSEHPIPWRVASGLAAGLVSADRLFEIFVDHRFPPAPYRAFLAPRSFSAYSEQVQLTGLPSERQQA